jgi:uracil-DNA glycosylase
MHAILKTSAESFVYYRSFHFDVDIERVAYINAVRCRTEGNAKPERSVIFHCRNHFIRWLDLLRPRGVVYLGVFAERATKDLVDAREIPTVTISRQKNLTRAQRAAQMGHAMKLVSSILPDEGK